MATTQKKIRRTASTLSVRYTDTVKALKPIREVLSPTPVTFSPALSELVGHDVFLKWENKLRTGSFKERGAVSFLASLSGVERKRGVYAASAGNHALALSHHASHMGIRCHLFMPRNAPLVKVKAAENTGAQVTLVGETFNEAYTVARESASADKAHFVSPFDDPLIIAGQASIGHELLDQVPGLDSVIVPVGGGGLVAGIALVLKHQSIKPYVLGVQSEWVHEMAKKKTVPRILPVSIADGIAVKTFGAYTKPLVHKLVDKLIALSETEIASAIIKFLEIEHTVVEGAAAVTLGALLKNALPRRCKRTVLIVSGSNIDVTLLSRLIEREMGVRERLLKVRLSVPDRPGSLNMLTSCIAKRTANILEVFHDRSFAKIPGNVAITVVLEVRDAAHRAVILDDLTSLGVHIVSQNSTEL